jgi:hypothetical protein
MLGHRFNNHLLWSEILSASVGRLIYMCIRAADAERIDADSFCLVRREGNWLCGDNELLLDEGN